MMNSLLLLAALMAPPVQVDPVATPVLDGKTSGTYEAVFRGTLNWPQRIGPLAPDADGQLRHKEAKVGDWVHIFTQGYFDEWVLVLSVLSDGTIVTQRTSYHQDRWPSHVRWELVKGDPPGTVRTTNGAWVWPAPVLTFRNCRDITIKADISDVPGVAIKLENCTNVRIVDSKFKNWANVRNGLFGAVVIENSTNIDIDRSSFKDSMGIALMPRTGRDVEIADCTFERVAQALVDTAAIHAEGRLWAYYDLRVIDCTFDTVGNNSAPDGVNSKDVIAGVYSDDGRQYTRVERCTFRNVKIGVFIHGGSYVTAHRNDFAASVDYSIYVVKAPVDWVRAWNAKPENAGLRPISEVPKSLTFYLNRDLSRNKTKAPPESTVSETKIAA